MKRLAFFAVFFAAASALACDFTKVRVSPDGFGVVKTGMSLAAAVKKSVGAVAVREETLGITEGCYYAEFKTHQDPDGDSGVDFMIEDEKITSTIVQNNPAVKTAEGAHVGMNAGEVKKLYKGKWQKKENIYGSDGAYKIFVPLTKERGYMFECSDSCKDEEKITSIAAGELKSVQYVEGCL